LVGEPEMKYRVRFEMYTQKFTSIIEAESEEDAKHIIRKRLRFLDVTPEWKVSDSTVTEMLRTLDLRHE
jgi:hypothetical protein